MKAKWIIRILLFLFIIVVCFNFFQYFRSQQNAKLLSDLEGTIYYTERVDEILTLFKSDATTQNKTLIYSHKGKGKDNYGGHNDNIIDFYYDKTSQTIYFVAMHSGSWSMYSLKEGEKQPNLLEGKTLDEKVMMQNTNYIQNQLYDRTASSKQGSLYLEENGNESLIKKFHGIYDSKFTGYRPTGFSPDGKYLVYHSMEHLTTFGTLIGSLFSSSYGSTYIMDLETKKSTKFIDAYHIQWVVD